MKEPLQYRKYLFHYTTISKFMKIIDNGELWASSIYFMNDSQEIQSSIDCITSFIDSIEVSDDQVELQKLLKEIFNQIINFSNKYVSKLNNAEMRETFLISFSSTPDQLSQWRGYCPENNGICFCLPKEYLLELIATKGFTLIECEYPNKSEPPCIYEFINKIAKELLNTKKTGGANPRAELKSNNFEDEFMKVAVKIKDGSFFEEEEWRIVSDPIPLSDDRIRYRTNEKLLIPYIPLKLRKNESDRINIPKIWIGPTPHKELSLHSLKS